MGIVSSGYFEDEVEDYKLTIRQLKLQVQTLEEKLERLEKEDAIPDADWVEIDTDGLSVKEYLDQRKGDKTYYELVEELKAEAAQANKESK